LKRELSGRYVSGVYSKRRKDISEHPIGSKNSSNVIEDFERFGMFFAIFIDSHKMRSYFAKNICTIVTERNNIWLNTYSKEKESRI
jgi:hypothetical protein